MRDQTEASQQCVPAPAPADSGQPDGADVRDSDATLAKKCLQGDEAAWAALIEKNKRLIFSVPLKCGLNRDEAADVFQNVCVDLLSGLPTLRALEALPKWLIQVAYHHTLRYKRGVLRSGAAAAEQISETQPDEAAAVPERLLEEVEREQVVRSALAQVSSRCARLLRMLFFETPPRPYKEVARELSLAEGSIGFIRGRCLERLRAHLQKVGFK